MQFPLRLAAVPISRSLNLTCSFSAILNLMCRRSCLRNCDVCKALHCLVECCFLLVIDELNACVKNFGIPLNLLDDVQQSPSNFVVSLHVLHSHVFDVLVCRRNNLNDTVEEGVTDQGYNAR
jgi:hypothetical protein